MCIPFSLFAFAGLEVCSRKDGFTPRMSFTSSPTILAFVAYPALMIDARCTPANNEPDSLKGVGDTLKYEADAMFRGKVHDTLVLIGCCSRKKA